MKQIFNLGYKVFIGFDVVKQTVRSPFNTRNNTYFLCVCVCVHYECTWTIGLISGSDGNVDKQFPCCTTRVTIPMLPNEIIKIPTATRNLLSMLAGGTLSGSTLNG